MARAANGFLRRRYRIRAPAMAGTTMTMTMTMGATITIGTTTEAGAGVARSIDGRLGRADQRRPARDLAFHVRGEFGGARADCDQAVCGVLFAHFSRGEDAAQVALDFLQDRGGRAFRREHAGSAADFEPGEARFVQGRD